MTDSIQEEIDRAQEWFLENEFPSEDGETVFTYNIYVSLAAYASHVTAEKDKEIEQLRSSLRRLLYWVSPIAGDNVNVKDAEDEIASVEEAEALLGDDHPPELAADAAIAAMKGE